MAVVRSYYFNPAVYRHLLLLGGGGCVKGDDHCVASGGIYGGEKSRKRGARSFRCAKE